MTVTVSRTRYDTVRTVTAGGALYGTELGSVTLKRIGFFCLPIKHSTHTGGSGYAAHLAHAGGVLYGTELGSVTLKRVQVVLFCSSIPIKHPTVTELGSVTLKINNQHTHGVWDGDYGWGVRVRRPFGARGMSSVRYGTRLGDLKENWFLLCSN